VGVYIIIHHRLMSKISWLMCTTVQKEAYRERTVTAGLIIKYLNFIFNSKNLALGILHDLKNQNLLNILKLIH